MSPIAVFGLTNSEFTKKVLDLRRELLDKNYYKEEGDQMFTIPHLTFCINKDFDMQNLEEVEEKVKVLIANQKRFVLSVKEFCIMQNNIAALFDNTYSQEIAKKVFEPLRELGFELVVTDHMRLIRSEIKEQFLEEARKIVDQKLPKKIKIVGIAIAGKLLRQEDVLWNNLLTTN